jgi:hypothetical protein
MAECIAERCDRLAAGDRVGVLPKLKGLAEWVNVIAL